MKFTDEQRLIVMMLADIQKTLGVRGEFDPDFISKVASWKEEFALEWAYNGIFDDTHTPDSFRFVINVVDMWSFIEHSVKNLSAEERLELEAKIGVWGKEPAFRGFDGNNESEYMSHVRLLVEDLNRFSEFKGRDFNSHVPLAARYQAMLEKFDPIRVTLMDQSMSVGQLAEVLTAR